MGSYKRRCRRILKQYGKHMKCFDNRLDNPLDDSSMRKSIESCGNKKPVEYQRRIDMPYYAKKTRMITCYADLVELAK